MAKLFYLLLLGFMFSIACIAQSPEATWWKESGLNPYKLKDGVSPLGLIKVQGKNFIDEKGNTTVFKGLSISDPDKLVKNGKWSRKHFEVIKSWGTNLVRIPVHPVSVHQRGLIEYVKLLDQAVDWCTELGMYVIIDWHTIGNLRMEMFQNDMYNTSQKETYNFWKVMANHYNGISTVAFFEIFNEPTTFNGTLGSCSWSEWKAIVEDIIDIIKAHDKTKIPLVGGFDWAYDLRPVKKDPINRPGIAYVTHPYPGKCSRPREPKWEETFGFVADQHPIIATELGYMTDGHENHLIDDDSYASSIMNYFNKKGISWCIWVFDPDWVPQMIRNWEYEPTQQGTFFKNVMQGKFTYSGQ